MKAIVPKCTKDAKHTVTESGTKKYGLATLALIKQIEPKPGFSNCLRIATGITSQSGNKHINGMNFDKCLWIKLER